MGATLSHTEFHNFNTEKVTIGNTEQEASVKFYNLVSDEWTMPLVQMLDSKDSGVHTNAAWAVAQVCISKERQDDVAKHDGIAKLARLLFQKSKQTQAFAAWAIARVSQGNDDILRKISDSLAAEADNSQQFRDQPIKQLVQLLDLEPGENPDDFSVVENALFALEILAQYPKNRDTIAKHGGISKIGKHLTSSKPEVKAQAGCALAWSIKDNEENKRKAQADQLVATLIELLDEQKNTPAVVSAAAFALAVVAEHNILTSEERVEYNKMTERERDAFMGMDTSERKDFMEIFAVEPQRLAFFTSDKWAQMERRQLSVPVTEENAKSAVVPLAKALSTIEASPEGTVLPGKAAVLQMASYAISNLSVRPDPTIWADFAEQGAVDKLAELLDSKFASPEEVDFCNSTSKQMYLPAVQSYAAKALASCCKNSYDVTMRAVQAGAIPRLAALLRSPDAHVCAMATKALKTFSNPQGEEQWVDRSGKTDNALAEKAKKQVVNCIDAVPALVSLLDQCQKEEAEQQKMGIPVAGAVVADLPKPFDSLPRSSFGSTVHNRDKPGGVVRIECLPTTPAEVISDLAFTLANLGTDPRTKTAMNEHGAVVMLMPLLSWEDETVQHSASRALANMSTQAKKPAHIISPTLDARWGDQQNKAPSVKFQPIIANAGAPPVPPKPQENEENPQEDGVFSVENGDGGDESAPMTQEEGMQAEPKVEDEDRYHYDRSIVDVYQKNITESGAIEPLVTMLGSDNPMLLQNACAALANMAEQTENKDAIATLGAIKMLVHILHSRHVTVHAEAARAIAMLTAKNDVNRMAVAAEGGVPILIKRLSDEEPELKMCAAWALAGTGGLTENQIFIANELGLAPLNILLDEMRYDNKGRIFGMIRAKAARAIGTLLQSEDVRASFYQGDGIAKLARLLRITLGEEKRTETDSATKEIENLDANFTEDPEVRVQKNVLRALRHLAENDPSKIKIVEHGVVPLCIALLDHKQHESKIVLLAAEVLLNLSLASQNKQFIVREGALYPLYELCDSEDMILAERATQVLASLALDTSCQVSIFDSKGLDVLAPLLLAESIAVRESAIMVLANLSLTHDHIQRAIAAEEIILPHLVGYLETEHPILLHNTALAFSRFTREESAKVAVWRAEGLAPLVGLLQSDEEGESRASDEVVRLACIAISHLAWGNESNKDDLQKMDTNHHLVQLLVEGKELVQEEAAVALSAMAEGSTTCARANRREIVEFGGLRPLLFMLRDPSDALKGAACYCLGNLAHGSRNNQALIAGKRAIPLLLAMLTSENPEVQWKCCWCLANLAQLPANKILIAQQGAIPTLSSVVSADVGVDEQVQKYSAAAVAYLAAGNDENKIQFAANGVVEPLCQMLSSNNMGIVENAAQAVAKLAMHVENRDLIGESGGVVRLAKLLRTEDLSIRKNVINAIANLTLGNEANKAHLSEYGAIPDICRLLDSHNGMVLESTITALAQLSIGNANKATIAEHCEMQRLCEFLSSPNRKMQEQASLALRHLSLNDANKVLLSTEDSLDMLIEALQEENRTVVEGVVHTIANVSFNDDNKLHLVSAGAGAPLVRLLPKLVKKKKKSGEKKSVRFMGEGESEEEEEEEDEEEEAGEDNVAFERRDPSQEQTIVEHVALALANLASYYPNRKALAEEGVIELLVPLLSSPSVFLQKCTCWALVNMCTKHDRNKQDATEAGAILPLIGLLQSHNHSVIETSAWCLGVLAQWGENSTSVFNAKAMPTLIGLLQTSPSDRVLERVARLVGEMVLSPKIRAKVVEQGALVPCIIALLPSPADRVQKNSGRAMERLLESDKLKLSLSFHGLEAIVSQLQAPHEKVQRNAARAIGKLALREENRQSIADAGGLAPLVALLASAHLEVVEATVKAMSLLSLHEANKPVLFMEGAVPLLVPLMSSTKELLEQHAARTIASLSSGDGQVKVSIATEGGIPPMLAKIRTTDERLRLGDVSLDVLQNAITTLANLSLNDGNKKMIAAEGGIPILLDGLNVSMQRIVDRPDDEPAKIYLQNSVRTLANLSFDDSNKSLLVTSGGLGPFVKLLRADDEIVLENAVLAMGNLATLAPNKALIAGADAIPSLVELLSSSSEWILKCTTWALGNLLSKNVPIKKIFVGMNGVVPMVQLLGSPYEAVQECAAWACASLAKEEELAPLVTEATELGGHMLLINLLHTASARLHIKAARAIGWLAASGQRQFATRKDGSIPALVALMSSADERVQKNAAFALKHLSFDEACRQSIVDFGGIPPLVALLRSANIRAATHTVQCLNSLCEIEEYQVMAGLEGACQLLVQLTVTTDTRLLLACVTCLAHLSNSVSNKSSIFEAGGVAALLRILRAKMGSLETKEEGIELENTLSAPILEPLVLCLSNLSSHSVQVQAAIAKEGGVICLVNMLPRIDQGGVLLDSVIMTLAHICAHEENKTLLAAAGAIPPLLHYLTHESAVIAEGALLALAYLTTRNDQNKELVATPAAQAMLLEMLKRPTHAAALAAWVIANLASIDKVRDQIMDAEPLDSLIALLKTSNADAELYGAWAITNLCNDSKEYQLMAGKAGAITPLVGLLQSVNSSVHLNAVLALAKLTCPVNNASRAVEEGIVTPIVQLLQTDNFVLLEQTLQILSNISNGLESHKEEIVTSGALMALLKHMQSDSISLQLHATTIVARLSEARRNVAEIGNVNAVAALVAILDSAQEDMVQMAMQALGNLCSNIDNQIALTVEDGVPKLVRLLRTARHGSMLQQDVLSAFVHLSTNPEIQVIICSENGVQVLIQLLQKSEGLVLEKITSILAALAELTACQQALVEDDGLVAIVKLLTCNNQAVVEACMVALNHTATTPETRDFVVEVGAVAPLVALLGSSNEIMQKCAVDVIGRLCCKNMPGRREVILNSGIIPLIELLNSEVPAIQQNAAWSLASLAGEPENRKKIIAVGGVNSLANALHTTHMARVPESKLDRWGAMMTNATAAKAARALSRIADIEHAESLMVDGTLLATLLNILRVHSSNKAEAILAPEMEKPNDPLLQKNCVIAVQALVANCPDGCDYLAEHGLNPVSILVDILRSEHAKLQEQALKLMVTITNTPSTAKLVAQAGAARELALLLQCASPYLSHTAAESIVQMVHFEENRTFEVARSCVPALIMLLCTPPDEVPEDGFPGVPLSKPSRHQFAVHALISLMQEPVCAEQITNEINIQSAIFGIDLAGMEMIKAATQMASASAGGSEQERKAADDHRRKSIEMLKDLPTSDVFRAEVLANLCLVSSSCKAAFHLGAIPAIITLMGRGSDDPAQALLACQALLHLCELKMVDPQDATQAFITDAQRAKQLIIVMDTFFEDGGPTVLFPLLNAQPRIQIDALLALRAVAVGDNMRNAIIEGGKESMPVITDILASDIDLDVRMGLRPRVTKPPTPPPGLSDAVLEAEKKKWEEAQPEIPDYESPRLIAAHVCGELGKLEGSASHLKEWQVVAGLLNLKETGSEVESSAAEAAIGFMSPDERFKHIKKATEQTSIPPLIALLESSESELVIKACRSMSQITHNDDIKRAEVVKAGGLPLILNILRNTADGNEELLLALVQVLHSVSSSGVHATGEQVVQAGVVSAMVKILQKKEQKDSVSSLVVEAAIAVLSQLAAYESAHQTFTVSATGLSALQLLGVMLGSPSTSTPALESAAEALSLLATKEAAGTAVVREVGIGPFVALFRLPSASVPLKLSAVRAIEHMASISTEAQLEVQQEGGVTDLVALFGADPDPGDGDMEAGAQEIWDQQMLAAAEYRAHPLFSELVQCACAALANLCTYHEDPKVTVAVEGGLATLIYFLGSTIVGVAEQATRLVSQLCTHEGVRELYLAEGGLPPLVALLFHPNCVVRAHAVCACSNTSFDEEMQLVIAENGGVEVLLHIMTQVRTECLEEAEFLRIEAAKHPIAEEHRNPNRKGFEPERPFSEGGCGVHNKRFLSADKVIVGDVLENVVRTISNLSWHDSNKPRIGVPAGIIQLLALLKYNDVNVAENASLALANISAVPTIKQTMLSNGAITSLMPLLQRTDNEWLQKCGVWAIASLCHKESMSCQMIVANNKLDALVDMLQATNETVQECSAWAIAAIALLPSTAAVITQKGAVPLLIRRILSDNPRVSRKACRALGNLMPVPEACFATTQGGGISALVGQLRRSIADQEYEEGGAKNAARALARAAEQPDGKAAILREGGVAVLISLLQCSNAKCVVHAVRALAVLATNDSTEAGREMVGMGVVPPLVELLRTDNRNTLENASLALAELSTDEENKDAIASSGAIGPLVALLKKLQQTQAEGYVLQMTTQILANLSTGNVEHCIAISDAGAVPRLVALLNTSDGEVLANALLILVNLSAQTKSKIVIHKAGAVDPLLEILRGSRKMSLSLLRASGGGGGRLEKESNVQDYPSMTTALPTSESHMGTTTIRDKENMGFSQSIQGPTSGGLQEEFMRQYALLSLACLSSEQPVKNELVAKGAIPVFLGMLQSTNENVQANASWAIANICSEGHDAVNSQAARSHRNKVRAAGGAELLQNVVSTATNIEDPLGATDGYGGDSRISLRPSTAQRRLLKFAPVALDLVEQVELELDERGALQSKTQ